MIESFKRVMLWEAWPHLFEVPSEAERAEASEYLGRMVDMQLGEIAPPPVPECLRGPKHRVD